MEGIYLMVSECWPPTCPEGEACTQRIHEHCPYRYSYWSENPSFDSPHNTRMTEEEARKDPDWAVWVAEADQYMSY